MSEKFSTASHQLQPKLLFSDDGSLKIAPSEETDAWNQQEAARTKIDELSREPNVSGKEVQQMAAGRMESMLLDLDDRADGDDLSGARAELEGALGRLVQLEESPDQGLGIIGVATKDKERLERHVARFQETGDSRLSAAVAKLNETQLVIDTLSNISSEIAYAQAKAMDTATPDEFDYYGNESDISVARAARSTHNTLILQNRFRRTENMRKEGKDPRTERPTTQESRKDKAEPVYDIVDSPVQAKELIYSDPDYLESLIEESEAYVDFGEGKFDTSANAKRIIGEQAVFKRDIAEMRQLVENWRSAGATVNFKEFIESTLDEGGDGALFNAASSSRAILRNMFWREPEMARRMARKITDKSETSEVGKAFAGSYFEQ